MFILHYQNILPISNYTLHFPKEIRCNLFHAKNLYIYIISLNSKDDISDQKRLVL